MSVSGDDRSMWRALLQRLVATPREGRAAVLRGRDGSQALLELATEVESLASTHVQEAITAAEVLVDVSDQLGTIGARARARRLAGQALAYGARLDESLEFLASAATLAESDGELVEAARARLTSLHPLGMLGRLEEAVAVGTRARGELERAGQPGLAARASHNLGNIERSRGNAAASLEHLAVAGAAFSGEPIQLALVENSRAHTLLSIDDFAGAERSFRTALELLQRSGGGFAATVVGSNLADLLARQGRLSEALAAFEIARRALAEDAAPGHRARIAVEEADALEACALPDEALRSYDAAIPALRAVGHRGDLLRALIGRGRVLIRLRRDADAAISLDEGGDIAWSLADSRSVATIDLLHGELLLRRGEVAAAESILRSAISRLRDRPVTRLIATIHLADAALVRADWSGAVALLDSAIEDAAEREVNPLRADLLHRRGRARRAVGDRDGAIADLSESIAIIERLRGGLQSDRLRVAFLGNRISVYQELVGLLVAGGPEAPVASLLIVERAKSRALLDLLRNVAEGAALEQPETTDPPDPPDPTERAIAQEIERIQREISILYSRLAGEGDDDRRSVSSPGWRAGLVTREAALETLERRMVATRSRGVQLESPADMATMQRALSPNEVLVEYFVADGVVLAWILRDTKVALVSTGIRERAVEDAVVRLQFQVGRSLREADRVVSPSGRHADDLRAELKSLHDLLLSPLDKALDGAERLIVAPHGVLHIVPFAALFDGEAHLVERIECVSTPSASIWAGGRGRRAARGGAGPLVVGVSDDAAPRIADEARAVGAFLGTAPLLGGAATVAEVRSRLGSASLAHIACHGFFSAAAPLQSGLRLADGWLTVRDILRLRLEAELVVLSGCDTGRSAISRGDELLGLVRSFLGAGASSMVVSLWSACDSSTAELMTTFHSTLANRPSAAPCTIARTAAALRHAQLAMLASRSNPIHWGHFIATGIATGFAGGIAPGIATGIPSGMGQPGLQAVDEREKNT